MTLQELLAQATGFTGQPIYRPETGQIDLGLTEKLQQIVAPDKAYASSGGSDLVGGDNTTGQVLGAVSTVVPPLAPVSNYVTNTTNTAQANYDQMVNDAAASQPAGAGTSEYDELKAIADAGNLNPVQKTRWDELNAPTGGGSNDGGLAAQIALARGAYDNAIRGLQNAFGEARGVYDEGIGLLGKRRGEFKDIYDTGNNDILTSFEGERGNLQRSSVNNKTRLRNILRATGMGGSAYTRGIGSQDKANLRNLGALSNEKTANERENLRGYNTNQDWANQQEGALGRYLQAAQNRLQEGVGKAGLIEQGDVAGINNAFNDLRSNIFSQNAALKAAQGDISGYTANPFAPNLSDMTNSLNVSIPSFGVDANQGQNVNQNLNNLSYLDLLKRRAGGSLYA